MPQTPRTQRMARTARTERRNPASEATDVDLARSDVRDAKGRRITPAYVDEAVADVHAQTSRRGRPSLTAPGARSPAISVRLTASKRAQLEARAKDEGRTPSDLLRDAVDAYLEQPLIARR